MIARALQLEGGPSPSRAPSVGDLAMTAGLLVVGVLGGLYHRGAVGPLLSAAMIVPLVWRGRWPFATFIAIAALALAQFFLISPVIADVALLLSLYTVAAHSPRARTLIAFAIVEVGVTMTVVRWPSNGPLLLWSFLTAWAVAGTAIGVNVSTRRAYLATVEDRAARLELERDQQGRLAAAAERSRIARELHDVVAHNLSVMIALADGAGYVAGQDADRALGAMRQVSTTGRQALTEMRRLLGILREQDADAALAPQPGLAQIEPLVEQVRAAGLPVRLETTGTPAALGPGAELTAFRLIQEALTNALKHAGPEAHAAVRLRYEDDAIDIEVVDDGAPAGGRVNGNGNGQGGQGLAGMRERVAVYGGAVQAGPRPGGGWRVHARLAA